VLASPHRLRRSADFQRVVRRGRRSSSSTVVLHGCPAAAPSDPTQVGFVVSKAVGNAVVRNRVKRRLRDILAGRIASMPGHLVVVRALPAAAGADYAQLRTDVDRCLGTLVRAGDGAERRVGR
jgi:ribonuclease P protein component